VITFFFSSLSTICFKSGPPQRSRHNLGWLALVGLLGMAAPLCAQERKPKVPMLDKITAAAEHQAFTGIVQIFDEKHNTLSVNSVEGGATETFTLKKGAHAITTAGTRIHVADLTPGTHVIVYYDLRADRRNVSRIDVLATESKKQAPPG